LYPFYHFRQVKEGGELVQKNPSGKNLVVFKSTPLGVLSNFGFAYFNIQEPGKNAYLSGTQVLKCTNQKIHKVRDPNMHDSNDEMEAGI